MVVRAATALLFVLFFSSAASAQTSTRSTPSPIDDQLLREARAFEAGLPATTSTAGRDAKGWRAEGIKAKNASDFRGAVQDFLPAVILDKANADSWILLARSYLGIDTQNYSEQYIFRRNAGYAAALGYARAGTPAVKAQALAVLAESFSARSKWREALRFYKASLALSPDAEVQTTYDELFQEHGFRMVNYTADNESTVPRICIQLSEKLGKTRGNLADFVTLNNEKAKAVRIEGSQLCVEDLKFGQRYQVKVRSGLPSIDGDLLPKAIDLTVYIRDRKPQARFTSRNYVLPRTGQQGIPVVSVNTPRVDATIYRIGDRRLAAELFDGEFGRDMGGYQLKQIADQKGEILWSGSMAVKSNLNEEVTTAFPIDELLPNLKPGLYVMAVEPDKGKASVAASEEGEGEYEYGDYAVKATQWFVVSDLGLTAFSGEDSIHVYVRSLADASPVGNVEVRLIARNNDVLATAKTDAAGAAVFAAALTRGVGGLSPALAVARRDGEIDYGFIDLTKQAFDLSDRGVGGRKAPGALDAFVFTERGVYRPGESVAITALLRDAMAKAVTQTPLIAKIYRPDGVEFARQTLPDQGVGGRSWIVPLPATAMTGTWRVSVFVDPKAPALYDRSFLVEDYIPERLEMRLTAKEPAMSPQKPAKVHLWTRFLYGAPGSNLGLEGDVVIEAKNELKAYPGFVIGQQDETFSSVRQDLEGLANTDAKGEADIEVALPELPQTSKPLTATATLRVREPSGRAILDRIGLEVNTHKSYIGVKSLFEGTVGEGAAAAFEVIGIGPDGARAAMPSVKWILTEVSSYYQWYLRDGRWSYEPVTYENKVAEGSLDLKADAPARIERKLDPGRYRLDVAATSGEGPATSVTFSSGWWMSEAADTPEILDLALDKPSYQAGEDIKVQILPRMAGKAMVSIVSDKVLATQLIDVAEAGATATFKADPDWGPGAYVTANLYRPMDSAQKRMPSRAVGVKWLPLDTTSRKLAVTFETDEHLRPDGPVTVRARVSGLERGEKAMVVVSGVDLGILNLTRYKTPKPEDYFLGQRRLGVEMRDIYGKLIDGMQGVRGTVHSGGDAGGLDYSGRPSLEKPLAVYSGLIEVGPDGLAKATFTLPPFNGTMRLAAQAWTSSKLGHGEKDVIVRDKVVAQATLPKFLTLGDTSQVHLSLENVEALEGAFSLKAKAEGALALTSQTEQSLNLQRDKRVSLSIPMKAIAAGEGRFTFTIAGPDNFLIERDYTLDIGAPAPNLARQVTHTLAPGASLELGPDLLQDFTPQSAKVALTVSRTSAFDVPGLLISLSRYPYGCAEQTTSRALPLLYFDELAAKAKVGSAAKLKETVDGAMARLYDMQAANGGFGLWGPGSEDGWLTAYVTEFLARARETGLRVNEQAFEQALQRLRNDVANARDFQKGGEDLAYGLYVLARTGRGVLGDLRYYADTKLEAFSTPLARAQLGAGLAMLGDKVRAEAAFTSALKLIETPKEPAGRLSQNWRGDYGTPLRDAAAVLALMGETGSMKSAIPRAVRLVEALRAKQEGTTTQEKVWLVLATRSLEALNKDLDLDVNGAAHKGALEAAFGPEDLKGGLRVVNKSAEPVTAVTVATGDGTALAEAQSKGFGIERKTYAPDGREIPFAKVNQNDRVVVIIKASEVAGHAGPIVLEDRLPAGFDIENPKLLSGSDLKAFSWLPKTIEPQFTSFRDDRFVAAFSLPETTRHTPTEVTVAYVMRAVTPGVYVHAGARVEDMYRADRFARTEGARVEILAAK